MNTLFPFGFPLATEFYLFFYILTLVIHVVFMNYVFAGTAYLVWAHLFTGGPALRRDQGPMALVLKDWMPFAVSAAITAGVAPLLFIQILYQQEFYTANLLLFHRWMSILPVLIVGFYLIYLMRSDFMARRSGFWRRVVVVGAFLCFAFTAYSWTENHLLSIQSDSFWGRFYGEKRMVFFAPELIPRLALWLAGSIPTMVVMVSWQLWYSQRRGCEIPSRDIERSAHLALGGLALALVAGIVYGVFAGSPIRRYFFGWMTWLYFLLAVAGVGLQAYAWLQQRQETALDVRYLIGASLGALVTIAGMTVVREAVRLGEMVHRGARDVAQFYPLHEKAFGVGGFLVFLIFFVVMIGMLAWCVILVRKGVRPDQPTTQG